MEKFDPIRYHCFVVSKLDGRYIGIDNGRVREIDELKREWDLNYGALYDIKRVK